MDYESERIVEDLRKERQSTPKNVIKAIDPKLLIVVLAIVLIGVWAVGAGFFTSKQVTTVALIAGVILLLIAYKQFSKTQYLTYEEAYALAMQHLEYRQRMHIDVPLGDIEPLTAGRLQRSLGNPYAWTFGFVVREQGGRERIFEVQVDPQRDGVGVLSKIPHPRDYDPESRQDFFLPYPHETGPGGGMMRGGGGAQ